MDYRIVDRWYIRDISDEELEQIGRRFPPLPPQMRRRLPLVPAANPLPPQMLNYVLQLDWGRERFAQAQAQGRELDMADVLMEQNHQDLNDFAPVVDRLPPDERHHYYAGRREMENRGFPVAPIAIDWMKLNYLGFPESVAISELPGSTFRQRRRDLAADLQTIKNKDITDVVCLLTHPEFIRYNVPTLLESYRNEGLVAYHYPIEDGKVPTDLRSLAQLLTKIKKRLADGNRVLVHCFGGMGRAVLIGCCLLMDLDEDIEPFEVIESVRLLRGPRAVQSVKQYNFINEYRHLRNQAKDMMFSSDDERSISR